MSHWNEKKKLNNMFVAMQGFSLVRMGQSANRQAATHTKAVN
jgi:hypothetical protein